MKWRNASVIVIKNTSQAKRKNFQIHEEVNQRDPTCLEQGHHEVKIKSQV